MPAMIEIKESGSPNGSVIWQKAISGMVNRLSKSTCAGGLVPDHAGAYD